VLQVGYDGVIPVSETVIAPEHDNNNPVADNICIMLIISNPTTGMLVIDLTSIFYNQSINLAGSLK
jgi:hypothetical protein